MSKKLMELVQVQQLDDCCCKKNTVKLLKFLSFHILSIYIMIMAIPFVHLVRTLRERIENVGF